MLCDENKQALECAGLSMMHCDWLAGLIDSCRAASGLLQDSTGMKMWKKRWFVLCDMCLFYYRGESSVFVYVICAVGLMLEHSSQSSFC